MPNLQDAELDAVLNAGHEKKKKKCGKMEIGRGESSPGLLQEIDTKNFAGDEGVHRAPRPIGLPGVASEYGAINFTAVEIYGGGNEWGAGKPRWEQNRGLGR